jgi:hypothetical protein
LLVVLDDVGWSDDGIVGVESDGSSCAPLAKEIPALIERDLDSPQTSVFVLRQGLGCVGTLEAVLLVGQFVDPPNELSVIHVGLLSC